MSDAEQGFVSEELMTHLHDLARGRAPIGVVYGSGFEDRPHLIAEMEKHFPIFGNSAAVVARVKDPEHLAELCKALAVPHPEIALSPPADPEHWLIKHSGGGGGLHVGTALGRQAADGDYYQRKRRRRAGLGPSSCDGEPRALSRIEHTMGNPRRWEALSFRRCSAAGGNRGVALRSDNRCRGTDCGGGSTRRLEQRRFSRQWSRVSSARNQSTAGRDARYFRRSRRPDLCRALRGMLRVHCRKARSPFRRPPPSAIYYAPFEVAVMPRLDWPGWCHDQQKPGTRLHKGDPVCTVTAEAETSAAARALLTERLASFHKLLTESASKEAAA